MRKHMGSTNRDQLAWLAKNESKIGSIAEVPVATSDGIGTYTGDLALELLSEMSDEELDRSIVHVADEVTEEPAPSDPTPSSGASSEPPSETPTLSDPDPTNPVAQAPSSEPSSSSPDPSPSSDGSDAPSSEATGEAEVAPEATAEPEAGAAGS